DKESIAKDLHGLTLDVLGIEGHELTRFRRMIREPYGMVLVTGPTGSGKTTTLYAALTEIYNEQEKIITIEDPVEYQLKGVVQIPVNEKKGLTFARGLRSILRHDPDKIMVGEIRDPETAQIAVQSALTGHLVFTTVHANNVFDVLGRFLHMGIDAYNFVSCLNCVAAQRLVRKICEHCKRPVTYDRQAFEESGLDYDQLKDHTFYEGAGCRECNGQGYHGRTAILELLDLDDDLRDLIISKAPVSRLKEAARAAGTAFLRDAAVEKLLNGMTTLEEINRVTFADKPGGRQ
ncbi:MAG: GspE/PulE family protein, partial [Desulfuromonadales bacterium]|nr:GspE/PulE family protein [Desulfuromonadales bacterium]